jgi:hypothetical protein
MPTVCGKKSPLSIANMFSAKNSIISISENILAKSESFFNKMCPFPRQDICIYVGYYFYEKTVFGLIISICI